MIKETNKLTGKLNASIIHFYPELEDITITPQLEEQVLKSEKYGFDDIVVKGIPATEIEIQPTFEEQTKEGIFKEVKVGAIPQQTLNIIPTEQEQTKTGIFTEVNVDAIQAVEIAPELNFDATNSIVLQGQDGTYMKKVTLNKDVDLIPENIKTGINILGIEGNLADTKDADATADDILFNKTAYVANTMLRGTLQEYDGSYTGNVGESEKNALIDGNGLSTNTANSSSSYVLNRLIKALPEINTSGWVSTAYMFHTCKLLEKIPQMDTSNVEEMQYMFQNCEELIEIPPLDASSAINVQFMFNKSRKLTNVGGFLNLGKAYTGEVNFNSKYTLNLTSCESLTHDSLMNIINGLYDLNLTYDVANGGKLYRQNLTLGNTNLAKLTAEEIKIASNKGWNVS